MPTITTTVDVDVEMDDFSDDDLLDEIASRGLEEVPSLKSGNAHPVHEIYYAFKFGLDEKATELARKYVCEVLGVIL